jgi:hypothetical protein
MYVLVMDRKLNPHYFKCMLEDAEEAEDLPDAVKDDCGWCLDNWWLIRPPWPVSQFIKEMRNDL